MSLSGPAVGIFSAAGTVRLVRIEGKMNRARYREILDENKLRTSDWGQRA
jgi:hypothetical protein